MEKRITEIEVTKAVLYTIPSRVRGLKCIEISFLVSVDKDGVGDETSDPPMYTFELHFPAAGLIDEQVTLLVGDRKNEINRSQMEDFACALCTFAVDVL